MLADFKNSYTFGFSKEFAIKMLSYFPLHLSYIDTLPCKILKTKIKMVKF